MANQIDFTKNIFCVVTGASKGIGQRIAIDLAQKCNKNSILFLLARSEHGLNETKEQIKTINPSIKVVLCMIDLTRPEKEHLRKLFKETLEEDEKNTFDFGIIIHNAGIVGNASKKTIEMNDLKEWEDYFAMNVFSVAVLNSIFIETLSKYEPKFVIINITSLCGRKPFKYLGMYGTGKAARELYFKVMAAEEPDFIILNYSPGLVNTNMANDIIKMTGDQNLKEMFVDMIEKKTILTTEQTVSKFIGIIEEGNYKSGDTIDYYDKI